ncbi:hypothetical protein ACFYXS_21440 [Streptomyces sp. NPDC002574]|uniref:hypothetical protein n=1 Tax=Streptomyces sp. NPDC002574 TaxID=3364652 RepID=UPI0036AD0F8F
MPRRRWWDVERQVSVEMTGEGYRVACRDTGVVGHGMTESEAWTDFWEALHADWKSPEDARAAAERRDADRARPRMDRVRGLLS